MKNLSSGWILFHLLLAGAALSGWLYGLHWERVASGELFTRDESTIIRLQEQIDSLEKENERLSLRLRSLEGDSPTGAPPTGAPAIVEPPTGAPPDRAAPAAPRTPNDSSEVVLPSSSPAPALPTPPQRIETH